MYRKSHILLSLAKAINSVGEISAKTVAIGGTSESNEVGAVTRVNIETGETGEAGQSVSGVLCVGEHAEESQEGVSDGLRAEEQVWLPLQKQQQEASDDGSTSAADVKPDKQHMIKNSSMMEARKK